MPAITRRNLLSSGLALSASSVFGRSSRAALADGMLGDVNFEFQLPAGAIGGYKRWLDIDSAVAGMEFTAGATRFVREIFASAADSVIAERLTSSSKGGLNFTLRLTRPASAQTRPTGRDTLAMTGNTDVPNLKGSVDYEVKATVHSLSGRPARVRYGPAMREVKLAKGATFEWNGQK